MCSSHARAPSKCIQLTSLYGTNTRLWYFCWPKDLNLWHQTPSPRVSWWGLGTRLPCDQPMLLEIAYPVHMCKRVNLPKYYIPYADEVASFPGPHPASRRFGRGPGNKATDEGCPCAFKVASILGLVRSSLTVRNSCKFLTLSNECARPGNDATLKKMRERRWESVCSHVF